MITQPTDAEIEALGHRMCWRYKHDTGVNHISTFTFNAQTLHDFARTVLAKWGQPATATRITVPTNTMEQDSEHQMAIMQCERNASLDAYSRGVSITSAESRLYEAGFTNGLDRRDRLAAYVQAPAGEPYCWHYWSIAGTSAFHLVRSNRLDADIAASKKHPDAHHIVPLYIHPQPMPLTDAQIKGLIEEGVFFGNCKEIVRAIEAAHGIGSTGGQHGAE